MKTLMLYLLIFLSGCTVNLPQEIENKPPIKEEITPDLNPEKEKTLFYEFEEEAVMLLNNMTIEEKIGQLLLARCPEDENIDLYMDMKPGGFIMFGKDFKGKTKEEIINNIKYYQKETNIPMIIGVDEEGGTVVRVSSNPNLAKESFKSPQELFNLGGYEEIRKDVKEKSILLKSLGINLNLSPVADVSVNEEDFIYSRAFGKSAEETAEYVKISVETAKENKISSTLKHFPGYGNNKDTHYGSVLDKRTYGEFLSVDFIPFKAGIDAGVESILISHNIVSSIDDVPASLSKKVLDILRNDMNFTGIIMTDDLSMGALSEIPFPEIMAIKAGNDMLIVSDLVSSHKAILSAVLNDDISENRINESVTKIIMWKLYMGL